MIILTAKVGKKQQQGRQCLRKTVSSTNKKKSSQSFLTSLLLLTLSQWHFILPNVSGSLLRELQSRTTRSRCRRFPNDGGIVSSRLPAKDRFRSFNKFPNLENIRRRS